MELSSVETRVLGCLIEKQRTTPDAYPLTLNALRLACNQSPNRDPVLELDDATIRDALERLTRRRWARLASGQGSRAPKYRHLLSEALGLADDELSLLAVLMLRGPQTPGELKTRGERLHPFGDLASVEAALERLVERGHVRQLERRPGQKEERYAQILGGEAGGRAGDRREGAQGRAAVGRAVETPTAEAEGEPLAFAFARAAPRRARSGGRLAARCDRAPRAEGVGLGSNPARSGSGSRHPAKERRPPPPPRAPGSRGEK
jgi:uncharacterized protein YceH (UPF0502 family)